MTQEELRAKLESYDLESLTIQRLLVVRDITRNEQVKIQRFYNELRDYNSLGVLDISNDVRDRIDECLQAIAGDIDIYEAFVSRAGEEIVKRAVRDEVIKTYKGMTIEELRRRLDAMKVEKKDYSELSVLELINELYELKYKLMYELATAGMAEELEGWLADGRMDVDAVTDELMEHIDVLGAMKRVCEEMLRAVCDKEF